MSKYPNRANIHCSPSCTCVSVIMMGLQVQIPPNNWGEPE